MNAFKAWWAGLEQRERWMVMAAVALILVVGVWGLIWKPLSEHREALQARVTSTESTFAWMQQARDEALKLKRQTAGSSRPNDSRSLFAIVDTSSRQFQVNGAIQRIEPDGKNGVNLRMEGVEFDRLMMWLGQLARNSGISTARATLTRNDIPGKVDGNLSLIHP